MDKTTIKKIQTLALVFQEENEKVVARLRDWSKILTDVCDDIQKAWSGSTLGHHAFYYYQGLTVPPPERHWNKEWGTINGVPEGWEYREGEEIKNEIIARLEGKFTVEEHSDTYEQLLESANKLKTEILIEASTISFPSEMAEERKLYEKVEAFDLGDIAQHRADYINSNVITSHMSRDTRAFSIGTVIPSQISMMTGIYASNRIIESADNFLKLIDRFSRQTLRKIEAQEAARNSGIKTYLDTNIFGRAIDGRIKNEEAAALRRIKGKPDINFYTSEKTRKEVANHPSQSKQDYLNFVIDFLDVIPEENFITFYSGALGSAPLGTTPFGGGGSSEDPIYSSMKGIFEPDDAEQIFQAVKSDANYFLTLDEATILSRRKDFNKLGYKTKIVSPKNLESILFAEEDNTF